MFGAQRSSARHSTQGFNFCFCAEAWSGCYWRQIRHIFSIKVGQQVRMTNDELKRLLAAKRLQYANKSKMGCSK